MSRIFPFETSLNIKNLDKTFELLTPNDPVMRLSVFLYGISKTDISKSLKDLRMSRDEIRKIENIAEFLKKISEGPNSNNWSNEEIRRIMDISDWSIQDSVRLLEALDFNDSDFLHSLHDLNSTEDLTSFESPL